MSAGWEDVLASCLQLAAKPGREGMPGAWALGRVLAKAVAADQDYPQGNLSMMDGYAVAELTDQPLHVEGENTPGQGPGDPLGPGSTRRIFTGAELPAGATRVVPQELVERAGDSLRIVTPPTDVFVRTRGSEGRKDEIVLPAGVRLTPTMLAILATVGAKEIEVTTRPRIAHLVTGNEIMPSHESGAPGFRIRDSNSDLIAGTLRTIGQMVTDHRRVRDDRAETEKVVVEMARNCEVLLISGGASVGDHDHAKPALEAAGFRFEAHMIEVRPGKPIGLARRGDQWAIALPGNPVSHLVALNLFVLPLLRTLEGDEVAAPRLLRGRLKGPVPNSAVPRRDTFWPSQQLIEDGSTVLMPCRFLSSGDLLGIANAKALVLLRAGAAVPEPGSDVFFLSLAPEFANA
jgi:molybdopterin molybdotransferase